MRKGIVKARATVNQALYAAPARSSADEDDQSSDDAGGRLEGGHAGRTANCDRQKIAVRRQKNREAAKRVRERRLNAIRDLTVQVERLEADNTTLKQLLEMYGAGTSEGSDGLPSQGAPPGRAELPEVLNMLHRTPCTADAAVQTDPIPVPCPTMPEAQATTAPAKRKIAQQQLAQQQLAQQQLAQQQEHLLQQLQNQQQQLQTQTTSSQCTMDNADLQHMQMLLHMQMQMLQLTSQKFAMSSAVTSETDPSGARQPQQAEPATSAPALRLKQEPGVPMQPACGTPKHHQLVIEDGKAEDAATAAAEPISEGLFQAASAAAARKARQHYAEQQLLQQRQQLLIQQQIVDQQLAQHQQQQPQPHVLGPMQHAYLESHKHPLSPQDQSQQQQQQIMAMQSPMQQLFQHPVSMCASTSLPDLPPQIQLQFQPQQVLQAQIPQPRLLPQQLHVAPSPLQPHQQQLHQDHHQLVHTSNVSPGPGSSGTYVVAGTPVVQVPGQVDDDGMLVSADVNLLNTAEMNVLTTSDINAVLQSEEILRFVPTPEEATASRSTAWL